MWYLFCDECRSRRNDPPAIWKSLPIPGAQICLFCFHNSQTESIQWHSFSHFLSQEFQEARRILNRSFDSCAGQAGHLGQSDGSTQPPVVMNSIYERCAGEWWARCVFISQSVCAAVRRSRRRPHRYLVLIYFCRLGCICLQIAFSSARLIKFDSSFWLKGSRNKTNSTFDI